MVNMFLIGFLIVIGFSIWKFIIEPKMNEGKPIEPPDDYETFEEKMEKSMNTNVDF